MVSPWMVHGNVNGCMEGLDRQGIEVPYDRWVRTLATHILKN